MSSDPVDAVAAAESSKPPKEEKVSDKDSVLGQRKRAEEESPPVEDAVKKPATEVAVAQSNNSSSISSIEGGDKMVAHISSITGVILPRAVIKILCPSECAGSIIGKGGSVISHINTISGANMKVSQSGDFFPSTSDRVILIVGEPEKLYVAIDHVVKHLSETSVGSAASAAAAATGGMPYSCRILLPSAALGAIIGRSGANIKAINEKAGAKCSLAEGPELSSVNERIMNISATACPNVAYAVKLIVVQLLADKNGVYLNQTTKYGSHMTSSSAPAPGAMAGYAATYGYNGYQTPGFMGCGVPNSVPGQSLYQQRPMQPPYGQYASAGGSSIPAASPGINICLSFGIPDCIVGPVLGRGGSGIKEIMTLTSTSIKVNGCV